MLKVAIIGCGKIADQHAEQILRIPGCEIVGVCDQEELMARQLQERLNVGKYFTEVQDLLELDLATKRTDTRAVCERVTELGGLNRAI